MEKVSKVDDRLRPFIQAMPDIFNYQIITKVALAVLLFLFGRIFQVALSRDLVTGQQPVLKEIFKEGFISIKSLLCVRGLPVVLYIALIAPILGIGLSITATKNLYIPTFISAVIEDSVIKSRQAF